MNNPKGQGAPRSGSELETFPSGYSDSIEVSLHFFWRTASSWSSGSTSVFSCFYQDYDMSAVSTLCFAPQTFDFVISRSILTWCPHTFLQNCHWRMIAVEVVSTLCVAFKGVTFYLRGDFTRLQCQHAGVWLYAPRGALTRQPSMWVCSNATIQHRSFGLRSFRILFGKWNIPVKALLRHYSHWIAVILSRV